MQLIWDTVLTIPVGRVATYGQVANEAGLPGRARLVGRAMKILPQDSPVPWHRVVNAAGRSSMPTGGPRELQAALLRDEGVEFERGKIDLRNFGWRPE